FFHDELAVGRAIGDSARVGIALGNLANIARLHGDLRAAVELYEQSVAAWRASTAPRLVIPLTNLGIALFYLGDPDRAFARLEEALAEAEGGDIRHAATT